MQASVQKTIASLIHHHRDGAASRAVMELHPSGETLLLREKQLVRLHGTAGWKIKVLGGAVWITQDGDVRDVVLHPGQSFTPDRDGELLISPFGEARICLTRGADCGATVRKQRVRDLQLLPARVVAA
ncbi:MAG TPA: DUF2917 domain-containing protein [Noviherbaspirillum sp.]